MSYPYHNKCGRCYGTGLKRMHGRPGMYFCDCADGQRLRNLEAEALEEPTEMIEPCPVCGGLGIEHDPGAEEGTPCARCGKDRQ